MEDAVTSEDAEPLPAASQNTDIHLRKPEDECPSSGSLEPSSPSSPFTQQAQGPAVSALQSKVKALSERRVVWKEPGSKNQDKRVVPGTFILGYALTDAWASSSSDEDGEPRKPLMFLAGDHKPQVELNYDPVSSEALLAVPRGLGEGASLENLSNDACGAQDNASSSNKSWMPPKCFWRSIRPEMPVLNGNVPVGKDGPNGGTSGHKMGHKFSRELQRSDSLESHLRRYNHGEVGQCGLWRADSLESMCSSGSSLSLAERVEMNRGLLKQMLQKTQNKDKEHVPGQRIEDPTHIGGRGICGLNDSDWDSGISLQGSEHSQRAFVLGDDLPLSPRHEQAKRLLERARMKARSNPLKADHTILPVQRDNLELLSWVGVPLHQAPLSGKEGVAVVSGNLSDSSSGDSVGGTRRRHGQSPTRVRFEDESEKDAEVRYLERLRQRRRAGERAQGLLVSKPNLSSYINGQAETGHGSSDPIFWKTKAKKSLLNGKSPETANRQCNSCGTFLNDPHGPSLNSNNLSLPNGEVEGKKIPCWVAPTLPNRLVRIEQIKETYIGTSPAIVHSDGTHCSPVDKMSTRGTIQKLKKKVRKQESKQEPLFVNGLKVPTPPDCNSGTQMCLSNGLALPLNPYALDPLGQRIPATCSPTSSKGPVAPPLPPKGEPSSSHFPQPTPPPLQPKKSALKSSSKNRCNGQRTVILMSSPEYHLDSTEAGGAVESCPQEQASSGLGYWEDRSAMVISGPTLRTSPVLCARNSPIQGEERLTDVDQHQSTGQLGSDATSSSAESTQTRLSDGHVRGPIRPVHHRATSPNFSQAGMDAEQREGRPKLSLRRFFSAMGLNSVGLLGKGRSGSMDQLSLHPKPNSNPNQNARPTSPSTSPNPTHSQHHQLKKAPSLQSIRLGSPFLQLRRSSSAQNLQIPRKQTDRSSAYTPGEQPCSPVLTRGLQRALSVEDVGRPSAVRPVGRVAQAFPDGTILLELSRPLNGPFGFLISRGKGRPDSGVYVEEMGDSNMEKLYAGLLGVGDEILEVNAPSVE
uniref:Si:dkey-121a11.3 n=1 Tax=Cyprinus carpio carpio TaxID=630221 RepID=A0A8C1ARS1_CYPCA